MLLSSQALDNTKRAAQYSSTKNDAAKLQHRWSGRRGFGVPAAIGAKITRCKKRSVGGFNDQLAMAILNIYKVPIVMLNHSLKWYPPRQEASAMVWTSESVFDSPRFPPRYAMDQELYWHPKSLRRIWKSSQRMYQCSSSRHFSERACLADGTS